MVTAQESAINGAIIHQRRRTNMARKSCGFDNPIFIRSNSVTEEDLNRGSWRRMRYRHGGPNLRTGTSGRFCRQGLIFHSYVVLSSTNFFIGCPKKPWIMSHAGYNSPVVPAGGRSTMIARTKESRRRLPLVVLCELLVLYAGSVQPSIAQAPAQTKLRIVVVEGEGAKNVAQQI